MQLTLKRDVRDSYPACGFFVEGHDVGKWIATLDRLALDPRQCTLYGLPTREANVVWGLLVLTERMPDPGALGPLATAHRATAGLIVPGKSRVVPHLTAYDRERLFGEDVYVLHPEFGLVKLTEPVRLRDHVQLNKVRVAPTRRPADFARPSGEVLSFSVAASTEEQLNQQLDGGVDREKLKDKPLSFAEKLRLKLYRSVLGTGKDGKVPPGSEDKLRKLAGQFGHTGQDAVDRAMQDYEDLQERNKKEVDKLLGMMERDPEGALRYAIPLDEHGYTRGGLTGEFKLGDRGGLFSLFGGFGGLGGSGGATIVLAEEYDRLRQRYELAAEELIRRGKYEKAAYVYLKLLKNYQKAARTLVDGQRYEQAAVVYVRYLKQDREAAECYEKAHVYEKAIPLYQQLKMFEKVGDLERLRGDETAAQSAYRRQLTSELDRSDYLGAAKLCQDKLNDIPQAQELLLRGWDENKKAYDCLRRYLDNLPDDDTAWRELQRIGRHQLTPGNDLVFVTVLGKEYATQHERRTEIRDLAYELLSDLLAAGRVSGHALLKFSEETDRLRADSVRYELSRGRRK